MSPSDKKKMTNVRASRTDHNNLSVFFWYAHGDEPLPSITFPNPWPVACTINHKLLLSDIATQTTDESSLLSLSQILTQETKSKC